MSLYVGQTVLEMYRLSVSQVKNHMPLSYFMRYLLLTFLLHFIIARSLHNDASVHALELVGNFLIEEVCVGGVC